MPPNKNKPVIFLAFANELGDQESLEYLSSLHDEVRQLEKTLSAKNVDGNCELKLIPMATAEDIFSVFQTPEFRNRIAIFHFGGHANGYQLLLEKTGGQNQMANAKGLAKFFGYQRGLELVFLNGCSTKNQANDLFQAGISAVIATDHAIDDALATRFAGYFYGGLAKGLELEEAFNDAEALAETLSGEDATDGHRDIGSATGPDSSSEGIPWKIYFNPESEGIRQWSLPKAADNHLFGLPKPEKLGLHPDNPYQKPHGFTEEDAEYFFGRDKEIRKLYDLMTDPDSAPIILFYGQAWVGKSSLLAAGLKPRLVHDHKVLSCQLDGQKNLSEIFRDAFETKDATPFLEAWKALEDECNKPVTVIIDQMEEVYQRHSKANKDDTEKFEKEIKKFEKEVENFLRDLLPIFEEVSSRPQGKLILSIRKEHEADLRQDLKDHGLGRQYREFFLQRLQRHGVMEAIKGPENLGYLTIESGLPELIAGDLLEDPESTVALTLQILLTEMWGRAKAKQEDEGSDFPGFDKQSYLELKRGCLHLEDFFDEKLKELKKWNEDFVTSGLVHDLLFAHVSKLNTAGSVTRDELRKDYSDRVKELVQQCKKSGLLVDLRRDIKEDSQTTRLTHDALAPVVRARFEESDRPGQRARKILENKAVEWRDDNIGPTLGKADLRMVQDGETGMRDQTRDEQRLVKFSERALSKQKVLRNGVIFIAVAALLGTSVYFVKARNAENRASEQKARVHAARVISLAESQDDPLLSSLLLLSLKGQPEPAHGVRVALKTVQKHIPRDIMLEHTGSVTSVECKADEDEHGDEHKGQVITASDDKTAKIWNLDDQNYITSLDGHDGELYGSVFNDFGDRFVTWTNNKVQIWDNSKTPSPTLVGCHAGDIYSVMFRPDGQHLLTATGNGKIRVWDVHNQGKIDPREIEDCNNDGQQGDYYGKLVGKLEIPGSEEFQDSEVMTASFSPDGRYVVAALTGGLVIWSVAENEYLEPYTSKHHLGSAVQFAEFSSENADPADKSAYLVTVDDSNYNSADLWKLETSADTGLVTNLIGPWKLEGHTRAITGVRFSPDNSQVLTISEDKNAMLWYLGKKDDATNPFSPVKLIGHIEGVGSAEFSPDGNFVVTGSSDDTLRVWNIERIDGSKLEDSLEFIGHTDDVTDVVFCPDSSNVVSTSYDTQVRLWDVTGSTEPFLLTREKSAALDARFSPDGNHVAAAFTQDTAKVWQLDKWVDDKSPPKELGEKPVKSIDFSPAFSEESDEASLKILTVRDTDQKSSLVQEWWVKKKGDHILGSIQGYFSRALYHPDRKQYVITTPANSTGHAKIWDGKGGETPLYSHHTKGEKIRYAELSNDGTRVVTATGNNALASNWMDQKCVEADERCATADQCAAEDEQCEALSMACDEAVRACSVEYKGLGIWLEMAVFSHDGLEVATASGDGQVRVFRAGSQNEYPPFIKAAKSIEFGPENQRLLAASDTGEARIWNKDGTGEPIILQVDDEAMNSARFDRLAERVVTASSDGAVRIWRYRWNDLLDYLDSSTRVCLTIEQRMRFLTEDYEDACVGYRRCATPDDENLGNDEDCVPGL